MSTSSVPIISLTECIDNCGTPTSRSDASLCAGDWTDGGSTTHVVFHDKFLSRNATELGTLSKHVRCERSRCVPLVGIVLDDGLCEIAVDVVLRAFHCSSGGRREPYPH